MTQGRKWPVLTSFAGYKPGWIGPDLIAGLTLAAIAVPEQMATARLAGLPPQVGFFAFLAGAVGFAVLGASRPLSSGADSTIAPIFAGVLITMAAAGSPHYAALAAALALMVGALVLLGGACRMGWVGDLLSIPVMTGFLAGIAVHILASQLPAALGVPNPGGEILPEFLALARAAPAANPACIALAVGALAMIAGGERLSKRAPSALAALVIATLSVKLLHLERHGVALLGRVSGEIPGLVLPAVSGPDWGRLIPLALIIALVVMVQTAAVSRAFAGNDAGADVDGDFRGVGLGNLLAGVFGAFPVDASPPRTAMVAEAGARSQLASLTAASAVILLLVVGTGLLAMIPTAALSGILLFVAVRLIRVKDVAMIFRRSPAELALTAATAGGLIVMPIAWGVALGVALSILHGVWSGARIKVQPMSRIPGSSVWWARTTGESVPGVAVLAFPAPLTFLNAEAFAREFLAGVKPGAGPVKLAVLEAAGIVMIDFTAARALEDVVKTCRAAGVDVAVARLESVAAEDAFKRLGLTDLIGADHIFPSVAEALSALKP
jgi:MFS superfamily sulfate permease-like transporter